MLPGSSLIYDENYLQSLDVDAEDDRIRNFSGEESDDSMPLSLSSVSEAPSTPNQHQECLQKHKQIVLPSRIAGELCSTHEIPQKYRHIFSAYPCFNFVQSKILDDVLYSDMPIIVSAPTGSGKTVIFELAIIRLLMKLNDEEYNGDFKIVYMAPVKALCSERFCDWREKFSSLGINCQEVTGDADECDLANLSRTHLILTTPEKWDSLTRKWKDNTKMVRLVKLFLIDEVHLLSEERRGPTLEAVVSRMKTITDVLQKQKFQYRETSEAVQLPLGIRFIAVSATIYNIEDVASWLGTSPDSPAKSFKISEDQRPVKLNKIVIGYPCPFNYSQFRFEISLSFKLRPLLFKYADGKPTLIFCSTRKGVDQTCSTLSQQITFSFSEEHKAKLLDAVQTLSENKLKSCIIAGVGYHHAGMDRDDRHTVENLFRAGLLPVLVTTSTLAIGVNLPAHLVIIKATQQYAGGTYRDYTETQILQMIGRAGRPQYDTSAVAIIMTKESQKSRYENLIEGKEPLESNLHRHLAEHLNSEVVLHTITEVGHAMEWIRSTFLYVRALRNPHNYGIPAKLSTKGIETKLQEMCQRELNALASANLLTVDNLTDIRPTANGAIMARFYLGLGTMKTFNKVTGQEDLETLLGIVAGCDEFSGLKLRVNEKKNLNLLNKSKGHETIRFRLPGKITTTEMKINCLIQAFFGCLPVYEQSLKQDMLRISWTGQRVTMALCQYLLQYKHYKALLHATILAKCFRCKLWENSPYVSRQLRGIGAALSSLLVSSQKTSFQAIAESNPRDIELILNRAPPMGDALKAEVSHLPKFEVKVEPTPLKLGVTSLDVYIEMANKDLVQEYNAAGDNHWLVLIIGTSDNKCLLIERFRDARLLEDSTFSRSVTVKHTASTELYINLISEKWAGIDISLTTKFDEPCQAKHTLDKYLQKMGIDSRGKSALQISSEAASMMKKKKRNSISEEINAINAKSNCSGSRLTLDKFKFTPLRNKKLVPSQRRNSNNKPDVGDKLGQNITLPIANEQLSEDKEQFNVTPAQTVLEKKDVSNNIPNNFMQPLEEHSSQERSKHYVSPNFYYDSAMKYKDSQKKDGHFSSVDDVQLVIKNNKESKNHADTGVLYTEPSETHDTPYVTYMQHNDNIPNQNKIISNSLGYDISGTAAYDNMLCDVKSNVTERNETAKSSKLKDSKHTIKSNYSAQESITHTHLKSSLTEPLLATQNCNADTHSFNYNSVSIRNKPTQPTTNSVYINKRSNSEGILPSFKTSHSKQNINDKLTSNTPGKTDVPLSCQKSPSTHVGENYLHGTDERGQEMIIPNVKKPFQNESSENGSKTSEAELSDEKYYKIPAQTNEDTDFSTSKMGNLTESEQKTKNAIGKRFYPLFFKQASICVNADNTEEEKKETPIKEADKQGSNDLQMEISHELQHECTNIQEIDNTVTEENTEKSSVKNITDNRSKLNNKTQHHPISSNQFKTMAINSTAKSNYDANNQNNTCASESSNTLNIKEIERHPKCGQNSPALNFNLVTDFDQFLEKLSSAGQNNKNNKCSQPTSKPRQRGVTPHANYSQDWAREYLFCRKIGTSDQHLDNIEAFQDQTQIHDVSVFRNEKNIKKYPVNYMEVSSCAKELFNNDNEMLQEQMHYDVPTFPNEKTMKTFPVNYIEDSSSTKNVFRNDIQPKGATLNCLKVKNNKEFTSNHSSDQSFKMVNTKKKAVQKIANKKSFNHSAKPKQHNILHYVPKDSCGNVNENRPIGYPPSPLHDPHEAPQMYSQSSQVNSSPYTTFNHRIKQKHDENNYETNDMSPLYEYSDTEEGAKILYTGNNDLSQIFPQPSTYELSQMYQGKRSDSSFNSTIANLEVHADECLEEEAQDYDEYAPSVANSPTLSNASPRDSRFSDLPSPPLALSSDDSNNSSQCSACQGTSAVEEAKEHDSQPIVPEQFVAQEHTNLFSKNNSFLTQQPARSNRHTSLEYPATQQYSEYKRPRSIYLPNDKLQKFCPQSTPLKKIKFSPLYKKMKWFPR